MEKKKGLILTICGAVAILLSGIIIVIGILDAVERSQYQNTAMNTPVVVVVALVFIAGAVALVMGIKKMKPAK
jgi:NADH:ubiquinone oxidoreductase subunit 6 (subunit J)